MEPSPSAVSSKRLDFEENTSFNTEDIQDMLPPTIKEEEAEIARLGGNEKPNVESASDRDEHEARIQFQCSSCKLTEFVHYYGKKPDFANGIQFLEDTYVMRDPFKPPPPRWKQKPEYFIAIGAQCKKCSASVCHDSECSFFYTHTFCLSCAEKKLGSMPPEAQLKLRKQLQIKQGK